jgi:hypothetical protein
VVSFTPRLFCPQYPLNMKLGGGQNEVLMLKHVGTFGFKCKGASCDELQGQPRTHNRFVFCLPPLHSLLKDNHFSATHMAEVCVTPCRQDDDHYDFNWGEF